MKRIYILFFLSLMATIANANCPLPPSGYYFGMAGWGDHKTNRSHVRCYYYHSGWKDQNEIDTYEYYSQNDLVGSQWYKEDNYSACRSDTNNVNDCAFRVNLEQKS